MRDKTIAVLIAIVMSVLTAVILLVIFKIVVESNGSEATASRFVEHNLPYSVAAKSPPGREMVIAERFIITAYSKRETCPDTVCITSSGKRASMGLVACPRVFLYGTRIEIKGKEYECADHTAKRFDGRIDIFMDSYEKALDFGIQELEVYINE